MSLPGVLINSIGSTFRAYKRGSLVISGVTKIAGAAAPCRVYLHDATDGLQISYQRSEVDGTYTFADLEAGAYYLVILDDRQDVKRAKVEHVILV